MELQQNTAYRNAYNSAWPGAGDLPGGPRMGYPFPPMPGHNSYPTYNHLGYPGAGSPGRDGKTEKVSESQKRVPLFRTRRVNFVGLISKRPSRR